MVAVVRQHSRRNPFIQSAEHTALARNGCRTHTIGYIARVQTRTGGDTDIQTSDESVDD